MIERPLRIEFFLEGPTLAAANSNPDAFNGDRVWSLVLDLEQNLRLPGSMTLSLGPGDIPPPVLPDNSRGGWLLDLSPPDWRSEWGGMLLFQGEGEYVHGYRPVPGALTVFPASAQPLISLITPQGARRTSILGWWS